LLRLRAGLSLAALPLRALAMRLRVLELTAAFAMFPV
jgi:hypothetical protein